jgi:hypothetical protein
LTLPAIEHVNFTIRPTASGFEITEGLPDACGITGAVVLVSFIYKHIQFTAWIPKEESQIDLRGAGRHLLKYAKMLIDYRSSQ